MVKYYDDLRSSDIITYVPSHESEYRIDEEDGKRKDHVEIIAKVISEKVGKPLICTLIKTRPQKMKGLRKHERRERVKGLYELFENVGERFIILHAPTPIGVKYFPSSLYLYLLGKMPSSILEVKFTLKGSQSYDFRYIADRALTVFRLFRPCCIDYSIIVAKTLSISSLNTSSGGCSGLRIGPGGVPLVLSKHDCEILLKLWRLTKNFLDWKKVYSIGSRLATTMYRYNRPQESLKLPHRMREYLTHLHTVSLS